jgi:hypothetical protein
MHRVWKQHYTPVAPPSDRPMLEHLLFALVLENAPYDAAEKIYNHFAKNFFDWNEVRVSTVTELAEVARVLPEPIAAASNVKRVLQGVFESTYSFDLEPAKKQNISAAMKQLERLGGTTPFSLGYVTQVALGGHAIPLDRGALDVLAVLGVISEGEAQSGKVSGLERVVPKNKGVEFASLLHQLAADYVANPFAPSIRKLLLSINQDAKNRFPKRGKKEEPREESRPTAARRAGEPATPPGAKSSADGKGKHAAERATAQKDAAAKHAVKEAASKPGEKESAKPATKSAAKIAEKSGDKAAGKLAGEKRLAEKTPRAGDQKPPQTADSDKPHRAAEKAERPDKRSTAASKHAADKHTDKHAEKHAAQKRAEDKSSDAKHRAAGKPLHLTTKSKSASKQLSKRKPR